MQDEKYVSHRVGGLEDVESGAVRRCGVSHRVGGLEDTHKTGAHEAAVSHRVGGLEAILFR